MYIGIVLVLVLVLVLGFFSYRVNRRFMLVCGAFSRLGSSLCLPYFGGRFRKKGKVAESAGRARGFRASTKSQAPNNRQAPNNKHQITNKDQEDKQQISNKTKKPRRALTPLP
jgi:hypothetical protein